MGDHKMVTVGADDWIKQIRRREPVELGPVEQRLLRDVLRRPEVLELWRRVVEVVDGQSERLQTLNTLDSADAAEALRIQGAHRALLLLVETFLENSNAPV